MPELQLSDLKTEGGRYSIAAREKALNLFEQYLTRPWLGSELSLNILGTEPAGAKRRTEYDINDGRELTVEWDHSLKKGNKTIEKSAIITSITVPDIGMKFEVNNAMAGHPQPVIGYSNLQVQVVLPAAKQDKFWNSPRNRAAQVAAHMGIFGTLYDNQFTTYGTLRINPQKPTIVLALETNVLDGIEIYETHSKQSIQMFAFKQCSFSMPIPAGGSSSNNEALAFIINIAFEDYDVFEGTTEAFVGNSLTGTDLAIGKNLRKESYLSVLAKTLISESAAKALSRSVGAGLGYKFNR